MKNKKNILLMIPLTALFVIAILIARSNRTIDPKESVTFTKIDNYNLFFGIDELANDYVKKSNSGKLDYYFYTRDIYFAKLKKNQYYLIVGDKVKYDYGTTKIEMINDVAYLVNVQLLNNHYEIKEIDNYQDYLDNMKLADDVAVKNGKSISKYDNKSFSDTYVINYYINYFKELLFVNYTKAYEMLDKNYKEKIGNLEDFNVYREDLYGRLNNVFVNYSITGKNGNRVYNVILSNDMHLEFSEKSIMNFSVNITRNE